MGLEGKKKDDLRDLSFFPSEGGSAWARRVRTDEGDDEVLT